MFKARRERAAAIERGRHAYLLLVYTFARLVLFEVKGQLLEWRRHNLRHHVLLLQRERHRGVWRTHDQVNDVLERFMGLLEPVDRIARYFLVQVNSRVNNGRGPVPEPTPPATSTQPDKAAFFKFFHEF